MIKSEFLKGVNPAVTLWSLGLVFAFVLYTIIFGEQAASIIDQGRTFVTMFANWWYVSLGAGFLLFCIYLACSKYGNVRLGDDKDKPEYGYFTWFAMLYAAGQGIGIIFWSIAEPIFHYSGGTPFSDAKNNAEAASSAMNVTFFHWGLNAWAIYCVVGLSLAFCAYRLKLPLTMRSTLFPLIGKKINGPIGTTVDVLAIFATLFGIATSLGLGATQINAGLNYVWGVPVSPTVQVVLIGFITAFALASVMSGLNKGIRILSITNMYLTFILLGFFILFGPTRYILALLIESTGTYIATVIPMSFFTDAESTVTADPSSWKNVWQGWWTVFYWGWWMSWAPFVGMFIARISKGRTVREFIWGVVGVSSLLSFVWLAAYGGTAMFLDITNGGAIAKSVYANLSTALYATMTAMNVGIIGSIAMILGTVLVTTYFVTSSDSGTLVLTTIMSNGSEHPLLRHRAIWGVLQGAVASILLVVGGTAALSILQTASIIAALPFSVVMVFMCVALLKGLKAEVK